jgi:hypothetical protein
MIYASIIEVFRGFRAVGNRVVTAVVRKEGLRLSGGWNCYGLRAAML